LSNPASSTRTLKLIVEYDGTDFCGYQAQRDGVRTVQSTLQEAVQAVMPGPWTLYAAGRTDTGVHGVGQVVSFTGRGAIPTERLARALNGNLSADVAVVRATEESPGFHARFSAVSRTYIYLISTAPTRSAIWSRYSYHVPQLLDFAAMQKAADTLVGIHDFAAYARSGGDPGPTTIRDLTGFRLRRVGRDKIALVLTANGFLRSMVRNLTGAVLEVGLGKLAQTAPLEILETRDRIQNPVPPLPPQGLCLLRVDY
jgi:tRNA pseudouridine38-40 synthase